MSEFVDHLLEVLAALGPVRAKRMFGGHGIYLGEVMFALEADEVLYLKADAATAPRFTGRGLAQFEYAKQGKVVKMSFFMAPEELFEDPDAARDWGGLALEAARRARRGKR